MAAAAVCTWRRAEAPRGAEQPCCLRPLQVVPKNGLGFCLFIRFAPACVVLDLLWHLFASTPGVVPAVAGVRARGARRYGACRWPRAGRGKA
eukprot:COSAG04_NODE_1601_length_6193_cov_7.603709_3_plen_92_part_00